MNKRLAKRFAIGVAILAALGLCYAVLIRLGRDPDPGTANTVGFIAALQQTPDGTRAVMISPDGKLIIAPGYRAGARDRSIAWRQDGQRMFFISDRDAGAHIYRWNPALELVERRTVDKGSKTALDSGPPGFESATPTILITAGGRLMDFDPREGKSIQVLPPGGDRPASDPEEGGTVGAFEAQYSRLGTAFKMAKWGRDRKTIVFTMSRDGGEVLAVQSLTSEATPQGPKYPPPTVVDTGDRISFDVASDGTVVYALQGFQWPDPSAVPPEFVKNGVATVPYHHCVAFFNCDNPADRKAILVLPDNKAAPGDLSISPDGLKVAVVAGRYLPGEGVKAEALVVLPIKEGGGGESVAIARGNVAGPSWTLDGTSVLYARIEGARQSYIESVSASGGTPTPVGPKGAGLLNPIMSPSSK